MIEIIENEVYKYKLRLHECYDDLGRLVIYPNRRPMQCMVLKNIADKLSSKTIYTKDQISGLISVHVCDLSIEMILGGLIEYGFVINEPKTEFYYLDSCFEEHYYSFLGLM